MESAASSAPGCPACGSITKAEASFCATCGLRLNETSQPIASLPVVRAQEAWKQVRSAAVCYLVLLAEVIGLTIFDSGDQTIEFYVGGDLVMLTVVLAFAWPIRSKLLNLFRVPKMDAIAWALLLLGPTCLWLLNHGLLSALEDVPGVLVSDPAMDLRLAGASTGLVFLLVSVTPPLLEETVFRGVIFEQIHDIFGTRSAAIVVSVLFSILHLALLSFIPFTALALVFTALRLRTGSLWPSILAHALFNLPVPLAGLF